MKNELIIKGEVEIWDGKKEKLVKTYSNAFMQIGKNEIAELLYPKYTHLVIGLGTSTVTVLDEKLENEVFRKEISTRYKMDNVLIFDVYIEPNEANFMDDEGYPIPWTEIGLYASGGGEKDSGILYNRAKIFEDNKNDQTGKTISWKLTVM